LESFVHDDPQTREARRADPGYFFQFDDFSTISIIRYLAGAANGRNLVHTVSVDSTLAPVEEFLSWYFQTGLHDSDDYLPLVLEPHHLEEGEGKRTVGIVSLIHPLIGSVLHWKEREGWGPGKLSREFDRVVEKMGLSGQIHSDLSDGTETRKAIKADIPDMESVFSQAAIALTDVLGRFKVGASARYTPREIKRLLANMGKIVRKDSVLESYVAVKRI
jgi:hypothetical protein